MSKEKGKQVMLFLFLCFVWAQTCYATVVDDDFYMTFYNHSDPVEFRSNEFSGSGGATNTHSCRHIRGVPQNVRAAYRLANFYQKYTEAYGIPILSSSRVPNSALQRACYTVRFIFADRYDIRNQFYRRHGRMAVIGASERTTQIPEFSHFPSYWDKRARGLGGTPHNPVSTCAEENALCFRNGRDRWSDQDIVLHEFAHGMHLVGVNFAIRGFNDRLKQTYYNAKRRGLWKNTYAGSEPREYFGEAVISYFNDNGESNPSNGIKNYVDTRAELKSYDPDIYNLVGSLFPCNNQYISRCSDTTQARSLNQRLKMNYPACTLEGGTTQSVNTNQNCVDSNNQCSSWAARGECQRNPTFMRASCKKSCRIC